MRSVNLLVISHVFTQPLGQVRWRKLAGNYDMVNVCLVAPQKWKSTWLKQEVIFQQSDEKDKNFEIRTLKIWNAGNDSLFLFKGLRNIISEFKPDIIYSIGVNLAFIQTSILKTLFRKKAKLLVFAMGVPNSMPSLSMKHFRFPQNLIIEWLEWTLFIKTTDAAVCHYPMLKEKLLKIGYKKPILVQTQIGVNDEIYYSHELERKLMRQKIGLSAFTIGYAGRIDEAKGIFDIAEAANKLSVKVDLLFVGDGPDLKELISKSEQGGWRNNLFVSGYVSPIEVPEYMRAMDCFVIGSRTKNDWIDTFPNAVAQAMMIGLPVIGSSSGAIPYMIGDPEMIFKESDPEDLRRILEKLISDRERLMEVTTVMQERAKKMFSMDSINKAFFDFISCRLNNSGDA